MKKKNKKMGIIFVVVVVILLAVIASLGVALASFNAQSDSGFDITYTADANVNAVVVAHYAKISNSEDVVNFTFTDEHKIGENEFDTNDQEESVTKNIEFKTDEIDSGDVILIRYTITNRDELNKLNIKVTQTDVDTTNMNVEYATSNNETADWKTYITDIIPAEGGIDIDSTLPGGFQIFIKVSVKVKVSPAKFKVNNSFKLAPVISEENA